MKLDVEFAEDTAKGEEVDDKQKEPQDRALGNTGGDREGDGFEGLELNVLSAAREVGGEPVQWSVGEANGR